MRRGSPIKANVYLRRLGSACGRRALPQRKWWGMPETRRGEWAFNFLAELVTARPYISRYRDGKG